MKTHAQGWLLLLMSSLLLCSPGLAQGPTTPVYYDNGPLNGFTDAWNIGVGTNGNYSVSDSFYLGEKTQITEVDFNIWTFPGDNSLTSVDWQISGGSNISCQKGCYRGTVDNPTLIFLNNNTGYNIYEVLLSLTTPSLNAGTYWLNLSNAVLPSGDPVYWDENSGFGCGGWNGTRDGCPSLARWSTIGTIPSESFTIDGVLAGDSQQTPEPSSIVLFAFGMLGVARALHRRLTR